MCENEACLNLARSLHKSLESIEAEANIRTVYANNRFGLLRARDMSSFVWLLGTAEPARVLLSNRLTVLTESRHPRGAVGNRPRERTQKAWPTNANIISHHMRC